MDAAKDIPQQKFYFFMHEMNWQNLSSRERQSFERNVITSFLLFSSGPLFALG
jgi:hypothetical protein